MLETKEASQGNAAAVLGWGIQKIPREEIAKTIRSENGFSIVELRSMEKRYCLSSYPVLSWAEAQLAKRALELFQMQAAKKTGNKSLTEFLNGFVEANQLELEQEQATYLLFVLERLAFGLGPLEELLKDDELEEIAITGLGEEKPVRVFHKTFGWLSTNLFFLDAAMVKNLVNRMARQLGRRLSMQTPRLNAVLENGSRIHAVIEPIAFSGPSVTIRKFRFQPFTPLDLLHNHNVDSETLAFLWLALQSDSTLLVCGNTGSGKTSTLNALFCFVPANERIVVVEETPEIRLPHEHQIRLASSAELGIDMHSLIVDSLRMRPDRIIVGEMRTASETKAFVDTLLAGQGKGSISRIGAC